jgi:hypothetical protein
MVFTSMHKNKLDGLKVACLGFAYKHLHFVMYRCPKILEPMGILIIFLIYISLSKGCHLDVVRGPSTPHDPESDAGGSLSSWQAHPSR